MSTRSMIGYQDTDGTVKAVYCHFDGYLSGVGYTLFSHYNSVDKAKELVSMGGISSLAKTIAGTSFYHRDRQEDLVIHKFKSADDFMYMDAEWAEYRYLFHGDGWFVINRENAEAQRSYTLMYDNEPSPKSSITDIAGKLNDNYDNYLLFTADKIGETDDGIAFESSLLSNISNHALTVIMAQILQNEDAIEPVIEALLQTGTTLEFQLTLAAYLENIEKEENKSKDIPIN